MPACAHIEATAFVSPKRVPQMADHDAVMRGVPRRPGLIYSALTPNLVGFEAAMAAGADEVAVFGAASESFSQKNIHCSIAESLQRFEPVLQAARSAACRCAATCRACWAVPYEGAIAPAAVADVAASLYDMGCHEISLGDTIGVGTPGRTAAMLEAVARRVPVSGSPGISTTPMARRWPMSTRRCSSGSRCSMPRWRDWAGVRTPRVPRGIWQPRICSTCSTDSASIPACGWTRCSRPIAISAMRCAADAVARRPRAAGGHDRMSPRPGAAWVRPLLLALLLTGLALLCLMILAPFITPIVWAAILAYASWPLYRRLRRLLHGYRTVAALLMTLMLGCAVVVPVLWIWCWCRAS
jgi:hypothetical protein